MTRDPWLDNAKMALVTLVVVGHAWTVLPAGGLIRVPYDALYAWHVPAFVFVTGYLSRSFAYTRPRMWQLVRTVAVPYVLFECFLALFRVYVGGEELEQLFEDPHWPMWYLAALFLWRLMTPLFRPLPALAAITAAVTISVVSGPFVGDTLDIARTLGLLPFFVLGLHANPERLARAFDPDRRVAAALVLVTITVAAVWTDTWASTEWLYYRSNYGELQVDHATAVLTRLGVIAVGTAGAWAFLTLVPRVSGWFTRMGAFTLVVYLFHGFFVLGAEYLGAESWAASHEVLALVIATGGGVGAALMLAAPRVGGLLRHAVDPFGLARREFDKAVTVALPEPIDMVGAGPTTTLPHMTEPPLDPSTQGRR